MPIDEEYLDVLQNIEKAIVNVYKARQDLLDMEVEEALGDLVRTYAWEAEKRGTPPLRLSGKPRVVFDAVRRVCEFRLGRGALEDRERNELILERKSLSIQELLPCLRRIRKSVRHWTSVGGRQGYLEYVRGFLEKPDPGEPD